MAAEQFKLCFDVGIGAQELVEFPRILISHGHLDHASGLPYYITQRALHNLPGPEIYVHPEFIAPFQEIMVNWSKLEDFKPKFTLIPAPAGKLFSLHGNFYFQAIPAYHRVPANGYLILEKNKKLKPEFSSLKGEQIAKLKKERDDLFYENQRPLIAFSGDTKIEFVKENELVRRSQVLFLECTYLSPDRSVNRARKWGHIHLDEIAENAELFREIEQLYLIHISPRYRPADIQKYLAEKLPSWLLEKTVACSGV